MPSRPLAAVVVTLSIAVLSSCQGLVGAPPGQFELVVTTAGGGSGTVTSSPGGISCPGTCTATFQNSAQVSLTATPDSGFTFSGWDGACNGTSQNCTVVSGGPGNVTATFGASLQSINHIIFLSQENRSFDSYFGAMRQYWAQNGIPDQEFDGLAQFNPPANPALAPSVPGCNPLTSSSTFCHVDPKSGDVGPPVTSFHFGSICVENPSPSWAESHADWNASDSESPMATMDGFVRAAANDARQNSPTPFFDVDGIRAMGYYDGNDLNYYYALATAFATSDRWFSPVMTRTPPNREFMMAATSNGYVYQRGKNPPFDSALIPAKTIFQALQEANISWRIYVPTTGTACDSNPTVSCLINVSYLHDFTYATTIKSNPSAYAQNIVPVSQFVPDVQSGNLPSVAWIEPASDAGLDEHPSDADVDPPCCGIQGGANYVSTLINPLMASNSWKDSVFILTFDEFGGFYDHVPPQPAVSPDGIHPVDLFPDDPCYQNPTASPTCDFTVTGYRVPMIVVSPFAKKNFVSHTTADHTAILKLIEERFLNSVSLTNRDAAQMDMADPNTGFFDFKDVPWKVPPTNIPAQNRDGQCFLDHVQ
jgi:phospholipase C